MSAANDAASSATPKDEWMTPKWIIDGVKGFAGPIDLDPATTVETNAHYINAASIIVKEEKHNGLWADWDEPVVWCNPPYSETGKWIEKARQEYATWGSEIFLLLPTPNGDAWGYDILEAPRLLFFSRRISFVDPATLETVSGNRAGSVMAYFGHRPASFTVYFERWGRIMRQE